MLKIPDTKEEFEHDLQEDRHLSSLFSVWELMQKFSHEEFWKGWQEFAKIIAIVNQYDSDTAELKAAEKRHILASVNIMVATWTPMDLNLSVKSIDKILRAVEGNAQIKHFRNLNIGLREQILNEMGSIHFLQVPLGKVGYLEPKEPLFGKLVDDNFAVVIDEIVEAAKCLALERSTASAFHSIRCLEAGIRALSRCLDISDPTKGSDRSWHKMLGKIKDEIDAKWPNAADRMAGDGQFFEDAYAALAAMQNPWRNATMHLDQKYTPEEAKHVFEVVGGFMRKLANRMDENGLPKA